MDIKKRRLGKFCGLIFLTGVLIALTGAPGWGAETVEILPITPLSEQGTTDLLMTKPGIPGARFGFIERVSGEEIVISDVRFRLVSNQTRYYQRYNGVPASVSQFQVGTYVGYILGEGRDIQTIWIHE